GRIDAVDVDKEITLVSFQDKDVSNNADKEMFDVDVLDVKVISTAKLIIDVAQDSDAGDIVSTASAATTISAATTTTTTITTVDDITLAQALKEIKSTKPKEKGIDIQELDQIRFDEENALKLQAAFDEEERLAREKLKGYKLKDLKLKEFDPIQEMFDRSFKMVTPTKPGRMTKLYSSHRFIANCFNARNLKMEVKEKKYICSLYKIHAERFPKVDMEETMNRLVRKEFKNFNEDTRLTIQHWKDSWHKSVYKQNQGRVRNNPEDYFSNHRITKVVRITTGQPHGLDFMEQIIVIRENDKSNSFSKADFKYLNKNDIADLYYLCRNKNVNYRETKLMNSIITFIRSHVIWERVHDFQLGIESYQIKVNLITPILTFPGIEAHEQYSIVYKPSTGLIYLNNKYKKWVMYLMEIVKFYDATLEKVLKEVKLKIFQSEPWRNDL
nr:hypothetical protein [Tanacetum cinerariifolium]